MSTLSRVQRVEAGAPGIPGGKVNISTYFLISSAF